ncbi:hypothetical protein H0I23_13590 [Cellulophaga sp. HaHaR_3_176]|uniref:hypothetical protein n=1 Tax=Cellulophaga sp. HaHaR_3_176 TaxID=1942464 RepID=UPI001C1FFAAB|nr:hypothetical protein [Cellulophaga sp. HaHaR_3_176]QWX83478.1 hypothetical protein H0I23_13590 [Cellulophaga sp. HaHaR_3_176]
MTNQIHIAAQYLATAGINFLDKKADDSHTNLGFNTKKGYLETWTLSDIGHKLALDYKSFSLYWLRNEEQIETFLLDGKTHKEIVTWIQNVTEVLGRNTPYSFALHYDLPYEKIADDFTFAKPAQEELNGLVNLRTIAQNSLEVVVKELNLETGIRIWPHHFDTGGFITLDKPENVSVGFGMAIPDTLVDDFYLYTSGYNGHEGISTEEFKKLSLGSWKNEGFKGAVNPMSGLDEEKVIAFFKETILTYKAL